MIPLVTTVWLISKSAGVNADFHWSYFLQPIVFTGALGQLLLNGRFLYQWYYAEKTKTADKHLPDGIFCFSDYIAYETLCYVETMNIRVPQQVSIIGFAGEPISEISRPKISTVQQPAELVGRRAAEILLWHLANPDDKKVITEVIPTQLVLRDTTRNI